MSRVFVAALLSVFLLNAVPGQDLRPHPMQGLVLEDIDWVDDKATFNDSNPFKTTLSPEEKVIDRETLLDLALGRARRSGKPVLWYVYKVVENTKRGRQMIRAPILDVAMRQTVWSDDGVERIVKSSFVPLRMVADEKLVERFGIRPLEFLEPSLVFLSADGEVLHILRTVRTFDANWIGSVLRGVLEKAHGPLEEATLDQALDRGEWARALELLATKKETTVADQYQRAVLLRRLRRGDEALAQLDATLKAWDQTVESLAGEMSGRQRQRFMRGMRRGRGDERTRELAAVRANVQAERGLVLARLGRRNEAVKSLREAADSSAGDRRAEASYWLGLLRLRIGDEMGANRRFQKIAQDWPDTRFGRRAKANVLLGIDDQRPIGAAFSGLDRLEWLAAPSYTALPIDTRWPTESAPLGVDEVVARSVRFLLDQQRDDGGWNDSRYSYCPDYRITPNVWVAISALACQALLRQRDAAPESMHDEIDDALRRGERYLLDASRMNRGRNEDVYSDVYRLDYLIARHGRTTDNVVRSRLRREMRGIIKDAQDRQDTAGFWAHEYANAFCTAPMIHALLGARDAGVEVPDAMLENAGKAVASSRGDDGSFSYSGKSRGKPRKDSLKNASTRIAFCEGALHALGTSDDARLEFAFDSFWKYYDRIEGVRRTDFHSDGQVAGFMFFHSLYHTIHAVERLPAEHRAEHRRKLLAKVLSYPEIDGTFMDSHEVGRSYGTAMALLVIAEALEHIE